MTQFSEAAWQRTVGLRAAIDVLPFNTELTAGTLSRERFQGYIVQDALYLGPGSKAPMVRRCKLLADARWRLSPSNRHCMSDT